MKLLIEPLAIKSFAYELTAFQFVHGNAHLKKGHTQFCLSVEWHEGRAGYFLGMAFIAKRAVSPQEETVTNWKKVLCT